MLRWLGQKSLKGQLVLRLAVVLGMLMVVMNIGFLALLAYLLPEKSDADEKVRPVIAKAVDIRDSQLVITRTADLAKLADETPSFWFVVHHPDGRHVSFGLVPPQYSGVLSMMDDIHFLDIRGEDGLTITANFAELDTSAGRLKVMYGGRTAPGSYITKVFLGLSILYIPFTLVPVVLVFLALPILVGRALSGLRKTISRAASIDANSLGTRLAKDDVVMELHPLVDAINSALARIDEDVSQRRRFFANAAHELRTPIAILQTRLEASPISPERERLLLDVGRLAATAEQLLDMQRFGNVQSWTDVDLVKICERVVADSAPMAIAAGYELGFDTERERVVVKGDADSLERAVGNLVRNAIEHGGGSGDIRVMITRDGAIEVADDGPGIPADDRDKVFEPFYRSRPKSTGAGLGLSIVRQIARTHHGEVSIVPQSCGACVRLKLDVG